MSEEGLPVSKIFTTGISERWKNFWYNYLNEWLCIASYVVGIVLVIGVIVGVFIGGVIFLDQRRCSSEAHGLGLEYKWGPLEGCLLKTPGGQYVPDGQYFINHPQP